MNKSFFQLCLCVATLAASSAWAQSTMTDQQVLEYAKQGLAQGRDKKTIMNDLVLRGVDRTQAQRVKKLWESQQDNAEGDIQASVNHRNVRANAETASEVDPELEMAEATATSAEVLPESDQVFGRSLFHTRGLTFAPSNNLATPRNYTLGPGDEVVIDIFGANQTTIRQTISNEGSIYVELLGPIYLSGKTIDEANSFLRKRLASIYAGLGQSPEESSDILLSLGQIRTIQVNMMGDVSLPGTYNLSSLSTAYHALHRAGGVKDPGTLRDIQVIRNGKLISTIDVYDFIMKGNRKGDVRLEEGDVVLVHSYQTMVKLSGMVKRPMNYEIKIGETLADVIAYAGGFSKEAFTDNVTIIRQNGHGYEVCTVDLSDFSNFKLKNGDEIEVSKLNSRFENRITLKGSIYQEGVYELGSSVYSIKTLIDKAGGLLPEAFTTRAVLHRERLDRSLEVLSVNVKGIMEGTVQDVILRNNDALYIPSIYDMQNQGTLTVGGEVISPGVYPYADNTSLEDLILMAGGITDGASLTRVDIARRVTDQTGMEAQTEVTKMFSFGLKEGFVVDGTPGFILEPYDQIIVRRAPSYTEQRYVSAIGEVNFTGIFPMTERDERLSELVKKAGGLTKFAYSKGARLVRRMNSAERRQMQEVLDAASLSGDSLSLIRDLGSVYYVAIELDKALAKPGSEYDLVLREGDRLEIPVYSNTVQVQGAVQAQNAITYLHGKRAKYYIAQSGGTTENARKRHAYVVLPNGHIVNGRRARVEPGSNVIVPSKSKKAMSTHEWLSIATTSATLATMCATIANIIK